MALRETIELVCHHGAIDIAILYLSAIHLLPAPIPNSARGDRYLIKQCLIGLEEAGSLLSPHHASRDGDDVVIWSLLFNERLFNHWWRCGEKRGIIVDSVYIRLSSSQAPQESKVFDVRGSS